MLGRKVPLEVQDDVVLRIVVVEVKVRVRHYEVVRCHEVLLKVLGAVG